MIEIVSWRNMINVEVTQISINVPRSHSYFIPQNVLINVLIQDKDENFNM